MAKQYKIEDYVGKRVSKKLTVVGIDEEFLKLHPTSNHWIFLCDCGNKFSTSPAKVILGKKISCGCLAGKGLLLHGLNRNEFYHTWYEMMKRCYDEKKHNYSRYGGRGIYVCEEWKNPKNFIDWAYETIGEKDRNYTVDRIDVNGPYAPWNCRWATAKEQGRNKSDTIMITLDGDTKPLVEFCDIYGLKYSTVRERLKRGWSIEETFKNKTRSLIHQPEKRVCDKYYVIDGIEKNVSDLAKEYGINRHTVYGRLNRGWDIKSALTIKPDKQKRIEK